MKRLAFTIIFSFISINLASFQSLAADDDYRYPDLEDYEGRGCLDFTNDCGDDHQKPGDLFDDREVASFRKIGDAFDKLFHILDLPFWKWIERRCKSKKSIES